jgi:endonuclease III
VTPGLFAAYPDAASLAGADPEAVESLVRSTGFFRAKTKSLIGMASAVVERFGGVVPTEMADLVTLPGVGRKTANVLRSVAFGLPGLPVDTHVIRLTGRLGLTQETDPVKIESAISPMVAPEELGALSLRLILHGRTVCVARRPRCPDCLLHDLCPSSTIEAPIRETRARTTR